VNGEDITNAAYMEDLRTQLYYVTSYYGVDWNDTYSQSLLPSFQDQVLQQMVQTRLALQLASNEGITIAPTDVISEETSFKDQVAASSTYASWDDYLTKTGMTEEQFQEQVRISLVFEKLTDAHGGSDQAEQVQAAHILVATEQEAKDILDKLQKGEAFADLAKQFSTDTASKESGGDLGWFPRGVMDPIFEEAAFALSPGETSGAVQTDYGYHIIHVTGKEVRAVDASMLDTVKQANFQTWFEAEVAKAKVETLVTFEQPAAAPTPTP